MTLQVNKITLESWVYYSKYENLNHNGPGHGIYAHLSYHIDFLIALIIISFSEIFIQIMKSKNIMALDNRTWDLRAFIVSYRFWNCLKISYRSRKNASKLSNIVSYLIIGWWNYQLSYRLLKALSAITGWATIWKHTNK